MTPSEAYIWRWAGPLCIAAILLGWALVIRYGRRFVAWWNAEDVYARYRCADCTCDEWDHNHGMSECLLCDCKAFRWKESA